MTPRPPKILEVKRVINDKAGETEKGQKHQPSRGYAHRSQSKKLPYRDPRESPPHAILVFEAKELLNDHAAVAAGRLISGAWSMPCRSNGNLMVTVVPPPSVLSIPIFPPCSCASPLTTERPKPAPS